MKGTMGAADQIISSTLFVFESWLQKLSLCFKVDISAMVSSAVCNDDQQKRHFFNVGLKHCMNLQLPRSFGSLFIIPRVKKKMWQPNQLQI